MKMKYKISIVSLNEKNVNEGITDFLRVIEQINRYGFLKSELDLAKKNEILSLEQSSYCKKILEAHRVMLTNI